MSSSKKAKVAFAVALVLLILSGLAAGFAIVRLYYTETLVRHTYDVEVAIGDVESSLAEVGRNRVAYISTGTAEGLASFRDAVTGVGLALARVRQLTIDNSGQLALVDRLEANAKERMAPSLESVEQKRENRTNPQQELQLTFMVGKTAFDTASIAQQMRRNEDKLLEERSQLSETLFTAIPGILMISFLLSAYMFWLHYTLLDRELRERRNAESQLRRLSLELMRVQDEEHRRFARELHDGLGQTLSAAKMVADPLVARDSGDRRIAEVVSLLADAISQTRTISHLFHPPFLDEIGFATAAQWLIEGYANRMGVAVTANIPQREERLPRSMELTLYRVLQEALNNIQRHAKSARAEVNMQVGAGMVTLRVKDYGTGISSDALAALGKNGRQAGVGLTAMKERVQEQGGNLEVRSEGTGTEIIVKIPLSAHTESANPN